MKELKTTFKQTIDINKAFEQAKNKSKEFMSKGKKGFIDMKTGKIYDSYEDALKAVVSEN